MEENNNKGLTDRAWQDMLQKLDKALPVERKKRRIIPFWWLGVAASVLLGLVFSLSHFSLSDEVIMEKSSTKTSLIKTNTSSNSTDQRLSVSNDGDRITSPKNSPQILKPTSIATVKNLDLNTAPKAKKTNSFNPLLIVDSSPIENTTPYENPKLNLKTDLNQTLQDQPLTKVVNNDKTQLDEKDISMITTSRSQDQPNRDFIQEPLPISQKNHVVASSPNLSADDLVLIAITPVQATQKLSFDIQSGYLVTGRRNFSDIGYTQLGINKPISSHFGIYMGLAYGFESTTFEYFKLGNPDFSISSSSLDYVNVKENIENFVAIQMGVSWILTQKLHQRFGIGTKLNSTQTTLTDQMSNRVLNTAFQSGQYKLRDQYFGLYELGYRLNHHFHLLGSVQFITSPLSIRNSQSPNFGNTYVGIGLRYQF